MVLRVISRNVTNFQSNKLSEDERILCTGKQQQFGERIDASKTVVAGIR
jgi:hypothetical protein